MAICPDNFRLAGHFDQTHKQATRNKTTRPYFLLVTLVRSSLYYLVIFNILTVKLEKKQKPYLTMCTRRVVVEKSYQFPISPLKN